MDSPFLISMRDRISSASNENVAACLWAEVGIYYARTDRIDIANDIVNRIRVSSKLYQNPVLYFWLSMLEGLIGFYSSATTLEKNKILRAHSIAKAFNRVDLQQYAAAWLAHHCFNSGDYLEMVDWLLKSGLDSALSPSAVVRSTLTVADAAQFADDEIMASSWYAIARKISTSIGDRASIMASIENRAAMKLDGLWFSSIYQSVPLSEILQLEAELLGGLSYEKFTKSDALSYQAPIWLARVEFLKENYQYSLKLLVDSRKIFVNMNASLAWAYEADIAWIYNILGEISEARRCFEAARLIPIEKLDCDDAAVYWRRLSVLDIELFDGARSLTYENLSKVSADISKRNKMMLQSSLTAIPKPMPMYFSF